MQAHPKAMPFKHKGWPHYEAMRALKPYIPRGQHVHRPNKPVPAPLQEPIVHTPSSPSLMPLASQDLPDLDVEEVGTQVNQSFLYALGVC